MSNIQEQIFEAIDIIAKQRINEIKFDKTVEAIIVGDEKAKTGEYQAKYQELNITIYSNSNTIKYKVGDSALVLVPQGDFSRKKTIVGSGSLKGEDYVDLGDLPSSDIDKMGFNFVDEAEDFTITLPTNSDQTVTFNLKTEDMITYYPHKKVLIIGMDLTTNIDIDDLGDYGIAIDMTFINKEDKRVSRTLKTRLVDIVGSPYQSRGYKEVVIDLPNDERLASVERGYAYTEGFRLGGAENTIVFSELNIQYGTSKDVENESEYSGNILTPKGLVFKSGSLYPDEEIKLIMEVKKQGSIVDNDEVTYSWFEIDEDITNSNQEGYHPDAGYGWRLISEESDGLTGTKAKTLGVKAKYIPNFSSFKCVAVFKDFIIKSGVVTVIDNTDELTVPIDSSNGYAFKNGVGDTTLKAAVKKREEVLDNSDFLFKWIRVSETGEQSTIRFDSNSEIFIDISKIGNKSVFICEVYEKENENVTIAKGSTTLVVVYDAPQYGVVVTGGFRAVLYDGEGKNPVLSPSNFEYTLFKNGEAITENLTQKWSIPSTEKTMLTMVVDPDTPPEADGSIASNAKSLTMGVDSSFSLDKRENVLKLTVYHTEMDKKEIFTEFVPISITKIGDTGAEGPAGKIGLDGSSYVYEIQNGSMIVSYDQNGLGPNPKKTKPFTLVFYRDGVNVTDEVSTATWSVPRDSLFSFYSNEEKVRRIETKAGFHSVELVAEDKWDEQKFNNILSVEFKYGDNVKFVEYSPILINKNAKDGEQGEGGYSIMLTNESHSFVASSDGALLAGSTKTSIICLKGSELTSFKVDELPESEYFTLERKDDVITIKTKDEAIPSSDSGVIDIGISIGDKKFIKSFAWSIARRGESGEAAKYVVVSGPQVFTCEPGYVSPKPDNLVLTSTSYGIEKTERVWSYQRAGETKEYLFIGETGVSLTVPGISPAIWGNANSIVVKCSVDGYYDQITLVKVANGSPGLDGESPYTIRLESSNGLVFKQDGSDSTVITATLVHGNTEVLFTDELRKNLFWEKINENGVKTSTENNTFSPAYFEGKKEKIQISRVDVASRATFNCFIKQ